MNSVFVYCEIEEGIIADVRATDQRTYPCH